MRSALEALADRPVSRETERKLVLLGDLIRKESARQNLVSRSSLDALWDRHIADSAQLVRFEPFAGASWIDIGSGAGLPGLVIACLAEGPVTLVEPRRLRADFLRTAVDVLELAERVTVVGAKAQAVTGVYDVITARAVAALDGLLAMTIHLSQPGTVWVLPKGRAAKSELEQARLNWQCDARTEGSRTDPDSEVLVLHNVHLKGRG